MHPKTEYMQLLLEYPEGLTSTKIWEIFWDDVTQEAISNSLRRLKYQGSTRREKELRRWRYFLTDQGRRKLEYLKDKEELEE